MASGVEIETTVADQRLSKEPAGVRQFLEITENTLFCDNPDIFTKLERSSIEKNSGKRKQVLSDQKGKEKKSNEPEFFGKLRHSKKS